MMLCLFRDRYPQGSLISKLVEIDRGTYIVQVSVTVDNIVLSTALAGAATVEAAEDAARERAIATLFLDSQASVPDSSPQAVNNAIAQPKKSPVEPFPSKPAAENIVNFSQKNPEVAPRNEVPISPTVPTIIPQPAAPKPIIQPEPIAAAQDSEPLGNTSNSGNLFAGTFPSETAPPTFPEDNSAEATISNENVPNQDLVTTEPEIAATEIADFKFIAVKQKTDIEIKRLGWTRDYGREFLQTRYGKRSRLHLRDEELLEFLHYLEQQPTPVN